MASMQHCDPDAVGTHGNDHGRGGGRSLPERVAQWYYAHGLVCSTYPTVATILSLGVVLLCSYPLLNIPLPGNIPTRVTYPSTVSPISVKLAPSDTNNKEGGVNGTHTPHVGLNLSQELPYVWAKAPPYAYVQQIVLRVGVTPWEEGLVLTDAYRGALFEVFKLLEVIRNHQDEYSLRTLGHLCLHVENVKRRQQSSKTVFPEYNCLVLSPANLWQQNAQVFSEDPNLLGTIFEHQNLHKGKVSTAEMVFGMNLRFTGIKRYPLRCRPRILQYAVTIFLQEYDPSFISTLTNKLLKLYPLHQNDDVSTKLQDVTLIYYPGKFNFFEFLPLTVAYFLLFLYIYFSVRKIELVKSKFWLAICAVITVMGSLFMSLGLCSFFGLTISMQNKEIFPYLVVLVGLENVLVLTKSVVSTDIKLDVKIRVAQGLSKEGWSISKNLLTELTILTIGLFTFVPVIQEFCIFAIVGLLSDFFLQMLFFATILAIDTRRLDFTVKHCYSTQNNKQAQTLISQDYNINNPTNLINAQNQKMHRSKSHPMLNAYVNSNGVNGYDKKKIPKREWFMNIWARTRFFQRAFMIWLVVWISVIIYNSGVFEQYFDFTQQDTNDKTTQEKTKLDDQMAKFTSESKMLLDHTFYNTPLPDIKNSSIISNNVVNTLDKGQSKNQTDDVSKLRHMKFDVSYSLSNFHWLEILDQYNMSINGMYVTVLPPLRLSHIVTAEQAKQLRHPEENKIQHFQWHSLAAALDPLDFSESDMDSVGSLQGGPSENDLPFYPTTPMELLLLGLLCAISVSVVAYTMVTLYRCVCSRNYADWRASWNEGTQGTPVTQLVLEAVPVPLRGHSYPVECAVTDGTHVASCCLTGQLKVWDTVNGQLLANIDRAAFFGLNQNMTNFNKHELELNQSKDDENCLSDYESGSPPSRDETTETRFTKLTMPILKEKINTNFMNLKLKNDQNLINRNKYNFDTLFKRIYSSDNEFERDCNKKNDDCVTENHQNEYVNHSCHCAASRSYESRSIDIKASDQRTDSVRLGAYLKQDSANVRHRLKSSQVKGAPQIWCLDFLDNLIAIGCANGRLEFWEGTTGKFKCMFEDEHHVGATSLKLTGDRVIVARLSGVLDFLRMESYSSQGRPIDWGFSAAYRRTHIRTGSAGSLTDMSVRNGGDSLRCCLLASLHAHQQPITVLDCLAGLVLTGSQDHTLKVFSVEDHSCSFRLHGHCGPISCLALDHSQPVTAMSGSQDGLLCVWELKSGTCMYSTQAHSGSVEGVTYSASYVISLGSDERMCIWDRFQGHLLNAINVPHTYSNSMLMLSPCLLVTARAGGLVVWDVRTGEPARQVTLGSRVTGAFVRHLLTDGHSVICDYGSELRVVRFPLLGDKND